MRLCTKKGAGEWMWMSEQNTEVSTKRKQPQQGVGGGGQLTLDEPLHLKSFLVVTNSIRIEQHMKLGACGAPWRWNVCSTEAPHPLWAIIELKSERKHQHEEQDPCMQLKLFLGSKVKGKSIEVGWVQELKIDNYMQREVPPRYNPGTEDGNADLDEMGSHMNHT